MADRLREYAKRRNFEHTAEPEGGMTGRRGCLAFVVQHHMARREHYDLRLEWDGAFLSWAVPKGPSYDPRDRRLAVMVEDHPLEYRNFEGTIPKGEYGGGVVMIWDEGCFEPAGDVEQGLAAGSLKFILKGRRLKGKWALVRMKTAGEKKDNWLLLKERDEYAKDEPGIEGYTTSIRTGRTMDEIERGEDEKIIKNPFNSTEVQLAKLVSRPPEGEGWLYELKYDGYRILAFAEGGGVCLVSRNKTDYTGRFAPVAASIRDWAAGRAFVLDGEMTVIDSEGKSDFGALQGYMKNPAGRSLTYIVFDLLALDGEDLRGQPLTCRKELLEELMKDAPPNLYYSRHVIGNGAGNFRAACGLGMEGIVGKKADSIYSGTRNGDWIKLKCGVRQEFVIGGYTQSAKNPGGVSSLLLGVCDGGRLRYVGRAGSGISASDEKELLGKFSSLVISEPCFDDPPKARAGEKFIWVEPELVAEVRFAEWTSDRRLRQASYKGLRNTNPREIKSENTGEVPRELPGAETGEKMETEDKSITVEGIRITNPDRVVYGDPDITKADVVRYYAAVAGRMLPYVGGRILSIVRCPKGTGEACFYKKHPGPGSGGIVTITLTTSEGEDEEYFYIEDKSGLIYEAQMGTIEFHIWGSRADNPERPDMMVFDLDPDVGLGLDAVRQGVHDIKEILSELSIVSFLKTSGGKGYHVVVPLSPGATWEAVGDFSRRVAEVMEQKWPERYTSNSRKAKRQGRVFIDWLRNGRGATSIAPYSLRARPGARVSMPLDWDELESVAPDRFDMEEALERVIRPDPWDGFFECGQQIK
ncbi:MAG TPA: DNA ligase D [Clostridiales bacterium]|nr:DNA ligase D [Clostridiales bacterium]